MYLTYVEYYQLIFLLFDSVGLFNEGAEHVDRLVMSIWRRVLLATHRLVIVNFTTLGLNIVPCAFFPHLDPYNKFLHELVSVSAGNSPGR